ncbi:MAG: hypothetical protein ACO2Z8_08225, partial [Burkholderiaceae bacterium]
GVPPVAANATSTLAAFPGYASSSWGFRGELAALPRRTVMIELAIAAGGGVLGATLLLFTPAAAFNHLVPCWPPDCRRCTPCSTARRAGAVLG